jgi:hypothetical protein
MVQSQPAPREAGEAGLPCAATHDAQNMDWILSTDVHGTGKGLDSEAG